MGKTRDPFKKIRDTNGTFHAKMSTIKDRNCKDLTESEDIKERWQEHFSNIQFKSIYSSAFSFLYSPTLTSIHD